jgi:hypothetical protein
MLGMAKKKKANKPTRKPKLDSVQNALRIVEEATGEKLAKSAKRAKSNGKA